MRTRVAHRAIPALILLAGASLSLADVVTPDGIWTILDRMPEPVRQAEPWVRPRVYTPLQLNAPILVMTLARAPMENTPAAEQAPLIFSLPMPDGSIADFRVVESPVMEPELAAKFPEIKTYLGQGITDPSATIRFDHTPQGFHAQILSPDGAVYIDPYSRGDTTHYAVYYKRDLTNQHSFVCLTESFPRLDEEIVTDNPSGTQLRTYRLACAATGEYTIYHGGTVTAGMSAITTAVNRVTGVYEKEVCARFILVANNDLIVYTNPNTDPYTNNSGSTMLGQNQTNLNAVIGSANYDIGHVFSTGGGGIANLSCVCTTNKARGVTGLPQPTGDPFYIDYVAHEIGHQFGGNHTFNGPGCGGGRVAASAFEPGSGSTIMAYAGICGSDNIQTFSDPYFHSRSYDEIRAFMAGTGGSCGTLTNTGNNFPNVSVQSSYSIPRSTPFTLTASGTDPDGDPVTFCWEQRNLGASLGISSGDNGSSPIMRSWLGTANPVRTIPRLQNLLNNTFAPGEILATTNRTLNFRVTARDNRAVGGGVNTADTTVNVISAAGPFVVTSPNTFVSWSGVQTVTWNVAGTNLSPINTSTVSILLSTNAGNTFPTTLVSGVPNTGAAVVTLPSINTTQARVMVRADNNIYFDISNVNFTITPPPAPPCYANCDQSVLPPVLNVADFTCFLQRFAAGESYANCDNSTIPPVLNVADFTCFLQKFAAGCP